MGERGSSSRQMHWFGSCEEICICIRNVGTDMEKCCSREPFEVRSLS